MTEDVVGVTGLLVDFAGTLRYDGLSEQVRESARNGLIDTLGVALAGQREPGSQMLTAAAVDASATGGVTILGTGRTAPPSIAAMIGGYAAHVLDYDDTQHRIGSHFSAPLVPAVLSLAEYRHRSGADVLAAYVAGFEVASRLGRPTSFAKHLSARGVHATGFLGHFAVAAAGANLLQLSPAQFENCFGIVASHASGTMKSFGTMSKAQNAGNAAGNGVLAAVLAEQGFTGPAQIFDGPRNVFAMFDAESDPVALADGLGLDFELTHNTMKMYACAGWRNPIIEAVVALMDRDQLDAAEIDRINVVACRYVSRLPNYPDPQSGLEAKFSAEHAAAVAAVDRAGGLVQFEDARATDPAIATLRRKVVLEFDDRLDDYAIRLAIRTSDGQEHATSIPIQKGDYRNPMTSDEVLAKFERNAATVLPPANVGALTALLPDLDSVDDIVELTVLCRAGR